MLSTEQSGEADNSASPWSFEVLGRAVQSSRPRGMRMRAHIPRAMARMRARSQRRPRSESRLQAPNLATGSHADQESSASPWSFEVLGRAVQSSRPRDMHMCDQIPDTMVCERVRSKRRPRSESIIATRSHTDQECSERSSSVQVLGEAACKLPLASSRKHLLLVEARRLQADFGVSHQLALELLNRQSLRAPPLQKAGKGTPKSKPKRLGPSANRFALLRVELLDQEYLAIARSPQDIQSELVSRGQVAKGGTAQSLDVQSATACSPRASAKVRHRMCRRQTLALTPRTLHVHKMRMVGS